RAAGVRSDELQRRRVGCRRDDNHRVVHRTGSLETLHHGRNRRALLADGDVHTDDAGALLVDDRVDRDRGLAGAAVADDQLTLAATDRDHRVDRLDAGLQRLGDRLTNDDARRDHLDRTGRNGLDRTESVDRIAERVDNATENCGADLHLEEATGATHLVAFLELQVVTHDRGANRVLLEVEHLADDHLAGLAGGELQHLAGDGSLEAVDQRDAVLDLEYGTDVIDVEGTEIGSRNLLEKHILEFARAKRRIGGHSARTMKVKASCSQACENSHKYRFPTTRTLSPSGGPAPRSSGPGFAPVAASPGPWHPPR